MSMTIRNSWKGLGIAGIGLGLPTVWLWFKGFSTNETLFRAATDAVGKRTFFSTAGQIHFGNKRFDTFPFDGIPGKSTFFQAGSDDDTVCKRGQFSKARCGDSTADQHRRRTGRRFHRSQCCDVDRASRGGTGNNHRIGFASFDQVMDIVRQRPYGKRG